MKKQNSKITFFLIITLFTTVLFSCKQDEERIPYAYVDFYADLNAPVYIDLNPAGNSLTVTGGVRGIILFHKNSDEFMAIERNCSHDPYNTCEVVEVDSTGIYAVCNCCGSKFSLYDGFLVSGPAKYPLNTYATTYNSLTNILHVYN